MRLAIDTGGTFTDLVVQVDDGSLHLFKHPTTPDDPVEGVIRVLDKAAGAFGSPLDAFLAQGTLLVHGTTRAVNAILTESTAKTAFLTTEGHPDILLFREGGRSRPFDFTDQYPSPYVPRSLTFEVAERIGADGDIVQPLDDARVAEIARSCKSLGVEAVGVCLLWSVVNPVHEQRVRELLETHLPGVPVTLSHEINPAIREYRRASSTCIDASLKPLMSQYMASLTGRLRDTGYQGRTLVVSSTGSVLEADDVARAPVHVINSGPALAPVAGRHYARTAAELHTAIVADTGGTTFDVSLVRRDRIPWTRETWIGPKFRGVMTGFPSVDIKSIGAGGGSIAWVDDGGLLRVGPESAGSDPGPACYGRGGERPTMTDASLLVGYLDPEHFLGGDMALDVQAAEAAFKTHVAGPLGIEIRDAAAAVLEVATEHMVGAINEITLEQGVDPASAALVGGGGAAGLNIVAIARRLGCREIVVPEVGAMLSAAGALLSDLGDDYSATFPATTKDFDFDGINQTLDTLESRCREFMAASSDSIKSTDIQFSAEARYPHQAWELDVPLPAERFDGPGSVEAFRQAFHHAHEEVFGIKDAESHVEIVSWWARVRCKITGNDAQSVERNNQSTLPPGLRRSVYFPGHGESSVAVLPFSGISVENQIAGPALLESPFTTVVLEPGALASRTDDGSLVIFPDVNAHEPRNSKVRCSHEE